jgi:Ca-activated chloride channel family protein
MYKFVCNRWRRCVNIAINRGFHMTRPERRGYGANRSPELSSKAYHTPLIRYALILATVLVYAIFVAAQDVNVHIEPKPPATPKTVDTKEDVGNADASQKNHGKPGMAVDVNLVLVNVTVTDDWNRIVTGLDKENFSVLEGSEVQQVRHFSNEDAPISLGVIFDMSGSMNDKIMKAREAVIEFFKTANPQDEFFMITFNDRPQLRADFTKSVEDIQGKLVYTVPQGSTAMLDAIYMGVSKMKDARNSKKALLIISDGGDNHSRYTENEIKSMVKEADVQIYSIGIFSLAPSQPEEVAGPALLTEISQVTGGRLFTISNPNELADVATKIGIELRNQYVLGYRPNNKIKDGHWRKIKVKLNPPKGLPHLNVYARAGYYAPSQ